ncbi:hypothetical protein [Amycolatopsis thermoflava]|uniref:hypothetical protein n=1 Tax=Amycolatopsis thermoflava TaxID=84480 RepID=UPI003F4A3A4A
MKRGLRRCMLALLGVLTLAIPSAAEMTRPAAPPVAGPPPVVPGCEQGCETMFSAALPGGHRLDGLHGVGGNVLAYWDGANLVDTTQVRGSDGQPYERVTAGLCGTGRCAVAFEFGAHSAAVAALRVDTKITVVDTAVEGVAADVRDLNADGLPDATVRQSTYEPSFALAPLYWVTYVQQDDHLVPTGCTTPVQAYEEAPITVATGACPTNV